MLCPKELGHRLHHIFEALVLRPWPHGHIDQQQNHVVGMLEPCIAHCGPDVVLRTMPDNLDSSPSWSRTGAEEHALLQPHRSLRLRRL